MVVCESHRLRRWRSARKTTGAEAKVSPRDLTRPVMTPMRVLGDCNLIYLHTNNMATALAAKQTHTIDPKLQPWVEK